MATSLKTKNFMMRRSLNQRRLKSRILTEEHKKMMKRKTMSMMARTWSMKV